MKNKELIRLEKKYFKYICKMIEAHLGEILNQIGSYQNIKSTADQGAKSNVYDSKLENIIEALITRQLGWNISVTPISADSCYECGDAIVHIDAKTRCEKVWSKKKGKYIPNTDFTSNKIVAEKNETTYDSENEIMYKGKPWKANLSYYIDHRFFGVVPNLTYFFVMDYDLDYNVIKIALVCLPHGQFRDVFEDSILGAGKSKKGNIRFLVNEIIANPEHEWRYKLIYSRKN